MSNKIKSGFTFYFGQVSIFSCLSILIYEVTLNVSGAEQDGAEQLVFFKSPLNSFSNLINENKSGPVPEFWLDRQLNPLASEKTYKTFWPSTKSP